MSCVFVIIWLLNLFRGLREATNAREWGRRIAVWALAATVYPGHETRIAAINGIHHARPHHQHPKVHTYYLWGIHLNSSDYFDICFLVGECILIVGCIFTCKPPKIHRDYCEFISYMRPAQLHNSKTPARRTGKGCGLKSYRTDITKNLQQAECLMIRHVREGFLFV